MTTGFNFKLGRARLNVERKREFVKRHQQELADLEAEFQLLCPHAEVEKIPVLTSADFYNPVVKMKVVCKLCGFTITK